MVVRFSLSVLQFAVAVQAGQEHADAEDSERRDHQAGQCRHAPVHVSFEAIVLPDADCRWSR